MLQLQSFDDCKQLSGSVIAMNPSRNGNKGAIYSYNLDSYKELTRQACLLRYICNSEAAWIKEVILTFGEDEQKAFATVESASKVNQSGLQEGTPSWQSDLKARSWRPPCLPTTRLMPSLPSELWRMVIARRWCSTWRMARSGRRR